MIATPDETMNALRGLPVDGPTPEQRCQWLEAESRNRVFSNQRRAQANRHRAGTAIIEPRDVLECLHDTDEPQGMARMG